jgi:hypothetical protein
MPEEKAGRFSKYGPVLPWLKVRIVSYHRKARSKIF